MARQAIVIVNASNILTDWEASGPIPMMQKQIDTQVLPAWGAGVVDCELHFATAAEIPKLPADCWPIFLNRHSSDLGALGWHTDEKTKVYGRVFVGDCMQYNLVWTIDAMHEIIETMGDPNAVETVTMSDGIIAAKELCDAVEADEQAVIIDGVKLTNFVFPSYFGHGGSGKYDQQGNLHGPCPTLTDGGYMELLTPGASQWTMRQQDHRNGLSGRRVQMRRFRHLLRQGMIRGKENLLKN